MHFPLTAVVSLMAYFMVGLEQGQPKAPLTKIVLEEGNIVDITGYYVCKGKEVSGKSYSGVTVITKRSDVYLVQWSIGSGAVFTGVGIRQGNTLACSWAIPADKSGVIRGINLYKIEAGPRLVGRWATIPGPGIAQSETLTFLKGIDPEEE